MLILPPQIVEAPSFESVAPGSTATLTFPMDGRRVRQLNLEVSSESGAETLSGTVSRFRLVIGGRTVRELTPEQLAAVLSLNGSGIFSDQSDSNDVIRFRIPFCEDWLRSAIEEDVLGLSLGGMSRAGDVQLQLDIDSGAIAPIVCRAWMEVDYPKNSDGSALRLGEIKQFRPYYIPMTAAGEFDYQQLPKVGKLHRLHIFSDKITQVEIYANNVQVFKQTKAENAARLARYGFNVDAAADFPVVFDVHQRISEAIDLSQVASFNIRFTAISGVTQFPMIAETRDIVR